MIKEWVDEGVIADWAYVSERLSWAEDGGGDSYMTSEARLYYEISINFAVNPSQMLDESFMLSYSDEDTDLGPTSQLYTARGAQGFGTYAGVTDLGVDPSDYE